MIDHLRYDRLVDGGPDTVVLLHSLALDATIWNDFASRLITDATVVAPDLPGHGRSPRGNPSTIEAMADDIADLLRSQGLRRITLIGMSLGGSVAQALTIRHSDLVSRLGLIDTTAWYGPDAMSAWAGRAQQAARNGLASLADFQLDRWFTDTFQSAHPQRIRRLLDVFQHNDIANYVASCNALGAMDFRGQLDRIDIPVAVVVGELDQATPPAHARQLAAAITGSELTVLPGCKHLSALEKPDDVIAALKPILA